MVVGWDLRSLKLSGMGIDHNRGRRIRPAFGSRDHAAILRGLLIVGIGALLWRVPSVSHAFDIRPTVNVLEVPGSASAKTLTVRNPRNRDLPITFEIFERDIAEDGQERRTPADDQFVIFPPQAVVKAGASQAVRVQWVGDELKQSRSFTLYAAEVPVDLQGAGSSGVKTAFRMGASVHVTPPSAQAKPVIVASSSVANGVRVTLGNEGDRFYYVDALQLTFGTETIGGLELANAAGRTLVPPGKVRSFIVPNVSGTPSVSFTQ